MNKTASSTELTRGHTLSHDEAVARIVRFTQRFGEAHFTLACHAAFPLALTPDLLYQIWANFVPQAPWTAVADVLLSPLCQERGYELYEMDTTIRTILREELEGDQNFGQHRLYALSNFLTEYAALQLNSDDPDVRDLGKSHQWTSLAYIQPGEAARELAQALLNLGSQDKSELLQIAALMETLAVPLAGFDPLLTYTRGITDLIRGDRKGARFRLREALGSTSKIEVAGMSLPIPEWVISEIDLFESADLIARSPYVLFGPAAGDMFFGREKILQEIATNINKVSYALTGGRRIGKTSILLQLHRNVLPAAGFQTIYHDCMITSTRESFLSAEIHNVQAKSLSPAIKTIGDLLESQSIKGQVVLLLDEADALISSEADAGWPLFSQLRIASEKGGIRFIFSAYQPFQESLHNPENPLFNSIKQVHVGLLDARDVKDLVIQPMQELGIELIDEDDIVQRIYTFTSGHPNIVQRLCFRLVERLVEQDSQSITSGDVDQITQNKQFLQNDYLSIYWESATPLEKIISLLMAINDTCRTPQTVQQAIETYIELSIQYKRIVEALERLVSLRYILKQRETKYVFAANAFPSVIESIVPVQDMLMTLRNEYYETEDKETPYNNRVKEDKSTSTIKATFNTNTALRDEDATYIQRRGDYEALTHLKAMDYIMIAEPFRQGKTSLMNHLMSHPQLENFSFAYIDMATLDHSTSELWYQSLCSHILQQLRLIPREEYPPVAQNSFEWRQFMLYVGKSAMSVQRNIVIVLDEIPVHIPDATEFFSIIRGLYSLRQVEPELQHITFLLAGTFRSQELIADEKVSPFNIAQRVRLADFTQAEVEALVGKGTWVGEVTLPELSKRIHYWTDGHPYLTQLLCSYLKPDTTLDDVDLGIDRLIRENADLLPSTFRKLKNYQKLREYIARIQTGESIRFYPNEYRIQSQLQLFGLIKANEEGFCIIRNRIYERILAPIRIQASDQGTEIPSMVTFLDIFEVQTVEQLNIVERWRRCDPNVTMRVPVGRRAGGKLQYWDVQEPSKEDSLLDQWHGPNALVAGTVGSGKSELLRSLLLSLAVNMDPRQVAFILLDFKPPGLVDDLIRRLPHTINTITDLQIHLVPRALESLEHELRRREKLFDEAATCSGQLVRDLQSYNELYRKGIVTTQLPYLILIVDEFPRPKQELPDALDRFVKIAIVGRALGFRMILATQRPSGMVTGHIETNTQLRACLRVATVEESREVVGDDEAAFFTRPGRVHWRWGQKKAETYQCAYTGVHYESPYPSFDKTSGSEALTQYQVVVDHIQQAAQRAGIERVPGIWLEPLPEIIPISMPSDTYGWNGQTWVPGNGWLHPLVGLLDNPGTQSQPQLELDLAKYGHLYVCSGTGASARLALRALVERLSRDHSPEEMNFYLLDFGNAGLRIFETLPHTGAIIHENESRRLRRLASWLKAELDHRRQWLDAQGYDSLARYHAAASAGPKLPALIVVIDNLGALKDHEDITLILEELTIYGQDAGIHFVLAGNPGTQASSLYKVVHNVRNLRIALELDNPQEYRDIVDTYPAGLAFTKGIAGRGLYKAEHVLECQIASPSSDSQITEMAWAMREATVRLGYREPQRIRELPAHVNLDDLLPGQILNCWATQQTASPVRAPLGLDDTTMESFQVNLETDGPHFLITGPLGGGKTTTLYTWVLALAELYPKHIVQFVLMDTVAGSLTALKDLPHVTHYGASLSEHQAILHYLKQLLDEREAAGRQKPRPLVIVVADDYHFLKMSSSAIVMALKDHALRGILWGLHVILAGESGQISAWDQLPKQVLSGYSGLFVGSNDLVRDGDIFGLTFTGAESKQRFTPGRGYFVIHKSSRLVQIATPGDEKDIQARIQRIAVADQALHEK